MMWNLSMTVSYYKATVMTEIIIAEKINKIGGRRMHKDSLSIDMTPMVDLGFLLIAFFIFTTEISKPAITNLYMPQTGDSIKIQESKSLTILLPGSDEIFYYFGTMEEAMKKKLVYETSFSETTGLGNIIRQKQNALEAKGIDKKELVVLIKPGNESSYKNVISALDEMLINGVSRYTLSDQEADEALFLKQ